MFSRLLSLPLLVSFLLLDSLPASSQPSTCSAVSFFWAKGRGCFGPTMTQQTYGRLAATDFMQRTGDITLPSYLLDFTFDPEDRQFLTRQIGPEQLGNGQSTIYIFQSRYVLVRSQARYEHGPLNTYSVIDCQSNEVAQYGVSEDEAWRWFTHPNTIAAAYIATGIRSQNQTEASMLLDRFCNAIMAAR